MLDNSFTLGDQKRTVLFEFSGGDGVYLIAGPVTFAETLEHCWYWACHSADVGEAFILVIYFQHCSIRANLSQRLVPSDYIVLLRTSQNSTVRANLSLHFPLCANVFCRETNKKNLKKGAIL